MTEINNILLKDLKDWFSSYVQKFKLDQDGRHNIELKEEHTRRVCSEILGIGYHLGLSDNELRLAEIMALFHDIGRFEQYARYKTFMDRRSENHAELGVKILKRYNVLGDCDRSIEDLILRTVQYHNLAVLPHEETEECLFFTKLLRDADKIDILNVLTGYYLDKDGRRNVALELDLPDETGFSQEVYLDLLNRKIVDINHVRSLNDFKLLQVGWVFDVNFEPALRTFHSRGYLETIRSVLPRSEKIDSLFSDAYAYLGERLGLENK